MDKKTALVTGGAGFIGSNLAKLLLRKGWNVRIIDNFSTGKRENIDGLGIDVVEGDICDQKAIHKACRGVDVVFHLAASVGRQRSIDNPTLDSTVNLIGTVNVLEGMRANSVKKIIYSSSAAIFGELMTPTIDENHLQNADSPYGVSKLAAEKMILAYSELYGIIAICLRYFNIYGEGQQFDSYGNVIPIFAKRIFNNEDIIVYGDGQQTRDFVNVKDVVLANYLAATKAEKTDVFNLGSGDSITINTLVSLMQDICKSKATINYEPKRAGDVMHCKAETKKATKLLGFTAAVPMEDGLKEYLSWFKRNCA